MHRFLIILSLILGLAACSNEQEASNENSGKVKVVSTEHGISFYGSAFDISHAISGAELRDQMNDQHECNTVIVGTVTDVCKKEGCWLNLDLGGNYTMQVSLHKFRVPKDCEGKTAFISGKAYMDTTSVDRLRDFAADAGKPAAEVDAITQPKIEMIFEAGGVGLK